VTITTFTEIFDMLNRKTGRNYVNHSCCKVVCKRSGEATPLSAGGHGAAPGVHQEADQELSLRDRLALLLPLQAVWPSRHF